jgi:hypothetical protein
MKHHKYSALVLTSAVLLTGCVGTGPNTQRGAVLGGALGALAGGVLGNNSGAGNGLAGAVIGGTVGAIAGGTIGNGVDHQRGTLDRSEAEATSDVVVSRPPPSPPPVPREVVVVRPAPEYVWIGGYYSYVGVGRYEWVPGRWEMPPPQRRAYVAPHWKRTGGNYVYVRGYWR